MSVCMGWKIAQVPLTIGWDVGDRLRWHRYKTNMRVARQATYVGCLPRSAGSAAYIAS